MYEIIFYEDKNGKSEIADFIRELNHKSAANKESRINSNKIIAYLDLLEEFGTGGVGVPNPKNTEKRN